MNISFDSPLVLIKTSHNTKTFLDIEDEELSELQKQVTACDEQLFKNIRGFENINLVAGSFLIELYQEVNCHMYFYLFFFENKIGRNALRLLYAVKT